MTLASVPGAPVVTVPIANPGAGPVAPVGPVGPVAPVKPSSPSSPLGPVGPVGRFIYSSN